MFNAAMCGAELTDMANVPGCVSNNKLTGHSQLPLLNMTWTIKQGTADTSKSLKSNKVNTASSPIRNLEIHSEQASTMKWIGFYQKEMGSLLWPKQRKSHAFQISCYWHQEQASAMKWIGCLPNRFVPKEMGSLLLTQKRKESSIPDVTLLTPRWHFREKDSSLHPH